MKKLQTVQMSTSPEPVRLGDEDIIVVENLSFRSKEAYAYLSESDDITAALINAAITGSIALRRAQSSIDSDFLAKQISAMLERVHTNLVQLIDPLSEGSLGQRLNEIFKAQNDSLKGFLANGQGAVADLDKKIALFSERVKKELETVIGNQLSDGSGKLGIVLNQLRTDIAQVRDSIVAERIAKTTSAPIIGAELEKSCQQVMEDVCQSLSLHLDDLRTVAGADNSKKGDYRVHGSGIIPIAIEVKNRDSRISLKAILKELSEACRNRACIIGVFVGSECIPPEAIPLNSYAQDKLFVCDANSFKIAVRVAIARARLEYESRRSESIIDLSGAIAAVNEIKKGIEHIGSLKVNCSAIVKNSSKIEDTINAVRADIEKKVEELLIKLIGKDKDHGKE